MLPANPFFSFLNYILRALVCLLWLLCGSWALASEVKSIPKGISAPLGKNIEYLEDRDRTLTIEQVMALSEGWAISGDEVFNQGYSPSTWWLKLVIENPQPHPEWFLEVAYAVLDYLTVYLVKDDQILRAYEMGDKLPFGSRPIEHRYFVVPVTIPQNERITVYIQVRSSSSLQVPITLWERNNFNAADIGRTALHGIYYGGLVIIAMYNLLIYLALGERTYLHYVGYVMAMFFFMVSLNGWSFQFLWPLATHWNDTAILVSLSCVVLFCATFTRRFLDFKTLSPVLVHSANLLVALSLIAIAASFVMPYSTGIRVVIALAVAACVWALGSGLFAWYRRNPSASVYVIAWSGLIIGGIILALSKFHVIPSNLFTDYATQAGSLMEVVLLSFALAERINRERALRFQAQQDALLIQRQANEELEQRVAARTLELEEANRKLQELSDTDQLTGLKNRRCLNQYLDKEVARAARYPHTIAILLVDIDHFKSVNDTHGHLVGDDCLGEVAKRIAEQMRWPSDLVARYGGEEFCLVLPETDPQGALTVAERIREKVAERPVETGGSALDITISIGVCAAIPERPDMVNDLLARADKALYRAKKNGRNRVEIAG